MSKDLDQLIARHKELDKLIQEGYTNYVSDASMVKMKQAKLQLKRQIDKLRQQDTA